MEDKEKEKEKEKKENDEDNKAIEIQNYQLKIKELNNKISVLIKGVKEEREKSKNLAKEIEEYNLQKIIKDETISKLKSENESLNSILSNKDPKAYFDNITKLNLDINFNPEEYDLMKKENVQLKEENKELVEQNSELIKQIEKITEEKKLTEKNLNEEIFKLKKERIEQINDIFDKQKKIDILNNLYKEIELQRNNKENEISKYKEEDKNYKKKIKNLENEIVKLKNMNLEDNNEINKLKKKIENNIKIEIDNYTFKGIILEDDFNEKFLYNKNINIKFSSTDVFVQLKFCNKNLEIDAKKIKFNILDKEQGKMIIFYEIEEEENNEDNLEENKKEKINIDNENNINNENNKINIDIDDDNKNEEIFIGNKNAMLCKFTERECEFIKKFEKEMLTKYSKNKMNKQKSDNIISSYVFGFFNDY